MNLRTATVSIRTRAARRVVLGLLGRFDRERLTLSDAGGEFRFGNWADDGDTELDARVTVLDDRAYLAIVTEGSGGFGRAYFNHWWDSDDPVAVLRVIIRNMAPWDERRSRLTAWTSPVTDRLRRLRPADTRERNRADISAHYDLGNELFALMLDETMTYSSAVFEDFDDDLAAASIHKYDLLLGKLGVAADDALIEIGSGWGGLAERAATSIGCGVTTTTISAEQYGYTVERMRAAGLTGLVDVLEIDWRDLDGQFDCLVSIEMIEAVNWREYDSFFKVIERLVRPGGRVALQAIVLPDNRWERAKNTVDFIRRYVFPNGYLPSMAAIETAVRSATEMEIVDVEDLSEHYVETLRRWRARFDDHLDAVRELGYDDRFIRLWRFYLMYSEAGFRERHIELKQIVLSVPSE